MAILYIITPGYASASTGVGINTGKIMLNGSLQPSTSYTLPAMMVYNTGDQTSVYEMEVTFNERQPELKPKASWVSFSPQRFQLAPHEARQVDMKVTIPSNVQSGNYYAYLEAHTLRPANTSSDLQAGASVSAAAAAKFYFSADGVSPGLNLTTASQSITTPSEDGPNGLSRLISYVSSYASNVTKELVAGYADYA